MQKKIGDRIAAISKERKELEQKIAAAKQQRDQANAVINELGLRLMALIGAENELRALMGEAKGGKNSG